jgi:Protein of unknown function (DUF2778)
MPSLVLGVGALVISLAVAAGVTLVPPADAAREAKRAGSSVFGTIHPQIFDLRHPVGTQLSSRSGVRVASLDPRAGAEDAGEANEISFNDRFASSFDAAAARAEDSLFSARPVAATPLGGATRVRSFAALERPDARAAKPRTAQSAPDRAAPGSARTAVTRAGSRKLASLEVPKDAPALTEPTGRTAVYDISARTVYMPGGARLEAHSGLGDLMDDHRHVNVKRQGATPPNVYRLSLRERPFHGVRAIRLTPIGDGDMFGRDGILAHTYMLGESGQSNGCISFKDYQAFLDAYLRGDVERIVVVERLPNAPDMRADSGWIKWLPGPIRNLLGAS